MPSRCMRIHGFRGSRSAENQPTSTARGWPQRAGSSPCGDDVLVDGRLVSWSVLFAHPQDLDTLRVSTSPQGLEPPQEEILVRRKKKRTAEATPRTLGRLAWGSWICFFCH